MVLHPLEAQAYPAEELVEPRAQLAERSGVATEATQVVLRCRFESHQLVGGRYVPRGFPSSVPCSDQSDVIERFRVNGVPQLTSSPPRQLLTMGRVGSSRHPAGGVLSSTR